MARSFVLTIILGSWVMTMIRSTGFRLSSAGGTGDRRDEAVLACVCCIIGTMSTSKRDVGVQKESSQEALSLFADGS